MNQTKPGMFSVWKLIALVISIGALLYKLACTISNFGSIKDWWGGLIVVFLIGYASSIVTITTSFTRGSVTLILSIIMLSLSICTICFEGIAFLGFAASLDDTPMIERGFLPLVNIANAIASVLNLIGFLSIRNKESRPS